MTGHGDGKVQALLAQLVIDKSLSGQTAQLVRQALQEATSNGTMRSAWRAAQALAYLGRAAEAASLVIALGAPWPADPRMLLALAPALAASGHPEEAAALARHALECLPAGDAPEVSTLAHRAYRSIAEVAGMDEAIRLARADVALTATSAARRFALASLLRHARRHGEALTELAQCRRLAPDRQDYAVALGQAMLRAAPPEEAVLAIGTAQRQWPDDPELLYQWSNALKACGRVPEATTAAVAAIRAGGAPRGAHAHAIGLLVRMDAEQEALEVVERALALEPPELNLGPVGLLLSRASDRTRAERLARSLLRLAPSSSDAALLLATDGTRAVCSEMPVARRLVAPGGPPPPHVFATFTGKGHKLHSGKVSARPAADVELLEMNDVTLHVFPFGFAVTDRDGRPFDLANPVLHAELVEHAHGQPFIAAIDELVLAADGKYAANNYCHWLLDYLPRILWASRIFPERAIAVPGVTLNGFRAASLDYLGFEKAKLLPLQHGRYAIGRFAAFSNCEHRHFRNALHGGNREYAAPLLEAFPAPAAPGARRLFLTRPPGNGRSFTNYEEVIAVVRAHGFEIIDPGRHGFAEQARMLGEAAVVAGPHGAALTNLLFCAPGTKVLEIFPQDSGTLPFAMLSAVRNLHYEACVGDIPPLASIPGIDGNRADFSMAPDRLREALSRLTGDARHAPPA